VRWLYGEVSITCSDNVCTRYVTDPPTTTEEGRCLYDVSYQVGIVGQVEQRRCVKVPACQDLSAGVECEGVAGRTLTISHIVPSSDQPSHHVFEVYSVLNT
jgi:hypothetical protein